MEKPYAKREIDTFMSIIALSVMAIDGKIEEGIRKGLAEAIEIYGE